ncbi:DM13 domain-containing protein [Candidatus Micrarchaeota archaeon]|nr:DM13 domain-containing protein [Candidatus Micrarchaeota archaeon]
MKAYLAFMVLAAALVFGCTAPANATATPTATASPAIQTSSATPAVTATVDVQAEMDAMMEENGVGTSMGQGQMTASQREAMAENAGSGNVLFGPNAFQRVQYDMQGSVSITERDGKKFLTFSEDFSTRAGPRLVVRLTKTSAPTSVSALDSQEHVLLHDLIDVQGYQEYELPADYDQYDAVIVFCEPFRVIWGYASLK